MTFLEILLFIVTCVFFIVVFVTQRQTKRLCRIIAKSVDKNTATLAKLNKFEGHIVKKIKASTEILSSRINGIQYTLAVHLDTIVHPNPEWPAILSLPKCGSSSLGATLASLYGNRSNIHQFHCSTVAATNADFDYSRKFARRYLTAETEARSLAGLEADQISHVLRTRSLLARISMKEAGPILLLGGVREPIGLMISLWFQYFDSFKIPFPHDTTADTLLSWVTETFHDKALPYCPVESWFVTEVKQVLGIDVFATPFDTASGFQVYELSHIRYALIRLDRMSQLPQMMQELVGVPAHVLLTKPANRTEDKSHAEVYHRVLSTIVFPESFVDEVYSGQYARTFWTSQELEQYRTRWTRPNH
ncbi:MAG: putative capsular polysaccharide synthesis family protein [Roseimicrobium sp.]